MCHENRRLCRLHDFSRIPANSVQFPGYFTDCSRPVCQEYLGFGALAAFSLFRGNLVAFTIHSLRVFRTPFPSPGFWIFPMGNIAIFSFFLSWVPS